MSSSAHILDRGGRLEIRWDAMTRNSEGRLEAVSFVIAATPLDQDHAQLEAWLERPEGVRDVMRRVVRCRRQHLAGFLHLDAADEEGPILQVTWGGRLVYARSRLLADAGLAPAGFDPPSARLRPAHTDLASA